MAIAPTPASGAVQQSGECTVYCCTTMYMYHRSTLSYQGPAVSSGPQKVSGPCRTALWARWSLLLPTGDPPRYRRVRRCVFCPHTQRGGAWALSEPAFRVSPPEDLTNHTYLRSRPRPATCFHCGRRCGRSEAQARLYQRRSPSARTWQDRRQARALDCSLPTATSTHKSCKRASTDCKCSSTRRWICTRTRADSWTCWTQKRTPCSTLSKSYQKPS